MVVRKHGYDIIHRHELGQKRWIVNGPAHESHVKLLPNVVVCILEGILTSSEQELVAAGSASEVLDGRVAFQADREDDFSAAVERLTLRRVVAFMSANQTAPGIACEMFFLDPIEAVP